MKILNFISKAKEENYFNLPLIFFLILSLILFCINSDNTFDYIFGDRALLRAKNLLNEFQFYGSEIGGSSGDRTLGGFLYYYLYFLISISKKIEIIYAINFAFISLSLFFFILSISKIKNIFTGVVSAALLITSHNIISILVLSWNPTFGFGFYLLAISFYINFLSTEKKKWLISSIILFLLGAQFHATFLTPLFFILIENFFTKRVNLIYLIKVIVISSSITYSPLFFKLLFIEPSSLEIFLDHFKDLSKTKYMKFSLREFINLLYKSDSFVQVSSVINLKIPFMMILTTIFGIYLLLIQNLKKEIREYGYLFSVLIFLYTFTFIYFFLKEFKFTIGSDSRHLLFIAPFHAIICGFGFNIIFNYFFKTKKFWISYFVVSIVIIKLSAFNLIIFKENRIFFNKDFMSIKSKNDLLNEVNIHYKTNSNYLINNFSIGVIENEKLKIFSYPFQYQIENFDFNNTNEINKLKNCLIAFQKNHKVGNELDNIKKIVNEIGTIENLIDHKKFYLIEYESNNKFCIHNLSNHYVLTHDEKISLDNQLLKNSIVKKNIKQNQMNFFFMIKDYKNIPVDIYIKLTSNEENLITAELISKRLRNSMTLLNGFWEKTNIENPELLFKRKDSEEMSIIFYKGIVGEMITTPIIIKNKEINLLEIEFIDIYFNYEMNNKKYSVKL